MQFDDRGNFRPGFKVKKLGRRRGEILVQMRFMGNVLSRFLECFNSHFITKKFHRFSIFAVELCVEKYKVKYKVAEEASEKKEQIRKAQKFHSAVCIF